MIGGMITYYTDGSCEPNPGDGGYAVIKEMKVAVLGGEPGGGQTTNIRMEGFAIIAALKDANGEPCQIYTDSEFWINVITIWSIGWEAKGWTKRAASKILILSKKFVRFTAPARLNLFGYAATITTRVTRWPISMLTKRAKNLQLSGLSCRAGGYAADADGFARCRFAAPRR